MPSPGTSLRSSNTHSPPFFFFCFLFLVHSNLFLYSDLSLMQSFSAPSPLGSLDPQPPIPSLYSPIFCGIPDSQHLDAILHYAAFFSFSRISMENAAFASIVPSSSIHCVDYLVIFPAISSSRPREAHRLVRRDPQTNEARSFIQCCCERLRCEFR